MQHLPQSLLSVDAHGMIPLPASHGGNAKLLLNISSGYLNRVYR